MVEYSYTSTHPLGHTGPVTGSLYLFIILYTTLIDLFHSAISDRLFLCGTSYSKLKRKSPGINKRTQLIVSKLVYTNVNTTRPLISYRSLSSYIHFTFL